MRKIFLALILTFISVSFLQAQPTREFTLKVNQQKTITRDQLRFNFISVVEDSRCPINAKCVWAGNAKVKISISKSRIAARTFELNTNLEPKTISYAGYEIKIVNLTPKPRTNVRINRNAYTATFEVRKL